jgi:hypothetical protein
MRINKSLEMPAPFMTPRELDTNRERKSDCAGLRVSIMPQQCTIRGAGEELPIPQAAKVWADSGVRRVFWSTRWTTEVAPS